MSSIIKHRRGPIGNTKDALTYKGEILVSSGSIGDLSGPFIHVGNPSMATDGTAGASVPVSKIYTGASVPVVTSLSHGNVLDGLPFYSTDDNALYRLAADNNVKLNLGGNIPTGSELTNVTASHATTASYAENAGASFPYTGSAEITGSLGVTGSIKNVKDNITFEVNSYSGSYLRLQSSSVNMMEVDEGINGFTAIAIGRNAQTASQGSVNIGAGAGIGASYFNVALGVQAGQAVGSYSSIAIGYKSGTIFSGSDSYKNIAIGDTTDVTGQFNVVIGYQARAYNFSPREIQNAVLIGRNASLGGSSNAAVIIGSDAGKYQESDNSVIIGTGASYGTGGNAQTQHSVLIGANVGYHNTGNRVILLGNRAGRQNTGDGAVLIGDRAGAYNSENGRFIIGSGSYSLLDGSFVSQSLQVNGSLVVTGKITAEEYHNELISSSIVYQSGSTKFGDTADDAHSFTGSIEVQNGGFTGSLFGTSSYSATSSYIDGGTF